MIYPKIRRIGPRMVLTSEFNSCSGALRMEPKGFWLALARGGACAPVGAFKPGGCAPGGIVPGGNAALGVPKPSNVSTFGAPSHNCVWNQEYVSNFYIRKSKIKQWNFNIPNKLPTKRRLQFLINTFWSLEEIFAKLNGSIECNR